MPISWIHYKRLLPVQNGNIHSGKSKLYIFDSPPLSFFKGNFRVYRINLLTVTVAVTATVKLTLILYLNLTYSVALTITVTVTLTIIITKITIVNLNASENVKNRTISTNSGSRNFLVHIHNFWIQKLQYFCSFWIQKLHHFSNFWIIK